MAIYFSDLKDYGRGVDLEVILQKYKIYFEKDFSVEQVIAAIHRHCERSTEIPIVADLMAILAPEEKKITQAEYVNAQKAQERNNFPMYSAEAVLIRDYEKQQEEDRAPIYKQPIHEALKAKLEGVRNNELEDKSGE